MAIGLLGRLAHCPQWPPLELLQGGRPPGLLAALPAGLLGLTGAWAGWLTAPPGGLLGALPAGLLGFLGLTDLGSLVGLLHLASLAPGLTGTWRGLRTGPLGWAARSRPGPGLRADWLGATHLGSLGSSAA